MHPTAEIRDLKRRLDAQEAELAALRGRLPPEPEKPKGPVLPPTCYVDLGNLVRDGVGNLVGRIHNGQFVHNPSEDEAEATLHARLTADRIERERLEAEERLKTWWVDPSGYRRKMDGSMIGRHAELRAKEAAEAAAKAAKSAKAA